MTKRKEQIHMSMVSIRSVTSFKYISKSVRERTSTMPNNIRVFNQNKNRSSPVKQLLLKYINANES